MQPVGSSEAPTAAPQDNISLPKVVRKESSTLLGSPRATKLAQPVRGARPDQPAEQQQSSIGASVGKIRPTSGGAIAPGVGRINRREQPSAGSGILDEPSRLEREGGSGRLSGQFGSQTDPGGNQPRGAAALISEFEQPDSARRRSRPNVLEELQKVCDDY